MSTTAWLPYVDFYTDISGAWTKFTNGTDTSRYQDNDWRIWLYRVFNANPTFKDIWTNPQNSQYKAYHDAFGYGVTGEIALAKKHFENTGNNGVLFTFDNGQYDGYREETRNYFGYKHWNDYGQYEARIIPGVPKIIYSNGQLTVNTSAMGTGNNNIMQQRYQEAINKFNNAASGTYMNTLDSVKSGFTDVMLQDFENSNTRTSLDSYYLAYKAPPPVSENDFIRPPDGRFDANYYGSVRPEAAYEWQRALGNGDLDFLSRYGASDPLLYYLQDYTSVGRHMGLRGTAPLASEKVEEKEVLTDAERQAYRDQVIGISDGKLVFATPEYDAEGVLTNEEEIDTQLEKQFSKVLTSTDAQKQAQFGNMSQDLLKISIDELKKAKAKESQLSFMANLPGYSEIMNINTTLTNSILGDSGIGGMLKITGNYEDYEKGIEKGIEQITGVSSNSTIYNWQKWFDDTLLKRYENYDYVATEYTPEEIANFKSIFENEIKIYDKQVQDGVTDAEKPNVLKIAEKLNLNTTDKKFLDNPENLNQIIATANIDAQKEFVTSFIDGYLKPRFDQSKSMDEFISYLDVKEEEQNIFQSQSTVNKLKQIAELRGKSFLDLINAAEKAEASFNADFYLDPLANNTKEISLQKQQEYALQKEIVGADFEAAKQGIKGEDGIDWALEAYRYGYENTYKTDPKEFAKLHYQVKGSRGLAKNAEGVSFLLDPAEDILPYEELKKKIDSFGTELLLRKELYGDASFMEFVTPEEFADSVLASVDPAQNKEEWKELLEKLGLDYTEDLNQVKEYLIESFRTDEAKVIRENIKYLNETKQDLTQKTLGVSYIERPTDVKEIEGEQTALYSIFKNAGYGGTEEDFYTEFMPDVDRSEQQLISKAMGEKGLEFDFGENEDPISTFSKMSDLFGESGNIFDSNTTASKTEDTEDTESSYFKIFGDDEEEPLQKSKAGQSFLGEFTSMFKGFS